MSEQLYDLGRERPPLAPMEPLFKDERTLARAALVLGVVLVLWKLYVACIANVIWEEGHFVVSGQHLALGYPDVPAGFPWLARLVTTVFGWHALPLRIVALAIATCVAPAVYFMASAITTRRIALWAAIFALFLPPTSLNGTIFYPEGALQVLQALMLGCVLRALPGGERKWWILAGVCAAFGLLIHFRFLVTGLAVVIFLLANAEARKQWTRPGIWITAGIGFLGLLPALIYNATHDWPAVAFHVLNRPTFDFNLRNLGSFILTQIDVVTPVFFVALGFAAWAAFRDDRSRPNTVLAIQAAVIFLFYGLQSPVNKMLMPHWPFMAYLPLLPYLPGVFIAFADGARTPAGRWLRGTVIALGPLMAFGLGVAITVYEYEFVHSAQLSYSERSHNILKNEDWTLLQPDLMAADARARARFGPNVVWAASGHISAVHIAFPANPGREIYTLDEPYDIKARFVVARHDWGLDRAALMKNQAGQGVVLALNQPSYIYHEDEFVSMYAQLCNDFEDIEPFRNVTLPPGRTEVELFTARVRAQPVTAPLTQPCALLPELYIAHPTRGKFLSPHSHENFFGIAADPIGITRVDVLIDHTTVVPTRYGLDPAGFRAPEVLKYDPNWPKVQYDFTFPPGTLTPGQHELSIRATRTDGSTVESETRVLYVMK